TALNTATAKADQPFEAVVIAPAAVDNRIVLGAGAKVTGHIKESKAAGQAGQADEQALLILVFDQISDGAKKASLSAKLAAVDNARESLDSDGHISGIKASETGAGRMSQGINKVAEKYPGLADLLNTVKQTVVKEPDPNIDFEPGVEMTIELTKPLEWTGGAPALNIQPIQPEQQLLRLVSREPFRTMADKPARPSDITNLMLLGTEEQVVSAFEKAGWSQAAKLNGSSKLETFRAMVEDRGYKEAPVSTLYLDGAPPDLVFEKLTDTFNARHHIRIWRRPSRFNGQQVWACAATHDTGIDFSEQSRTFTHKIDSQIDRERAKVVNDLLFTGLVRGLSLVDRELPGSLSNATGDSLQTDGNLAVLAF
ncbi:MAG TPA: LssY C-terminal domain-containing protein, partial [Bryobacteraceae bacterium]|nr:LssY C-terminal domain-containing protein [Bryobacteraceae bacterium]